MSILERVKNYLETNLTGIEIGIGSVLAGTIPPVITITKLPSGGFSFGTRRAVYKLQINIFAISILEAEDITEDVVDILSGWSEVSDGQPIICNVTTNLGCWEEDETNYWHSALEITITTTR